MTMRTLATVARLVVIISCRTAGGSLIRLCRWRRPRSFRLTPRDRMYTSGRRSNLHGRSDTRKIGAVAVVAGLLVGAGRPEVFGEDKRTLVEQELARFQGTWQLVSAEADGVKAPQDRTDKIRVVINGSRHTVKFGDREVVHSVPFAIDPTTTPKTVTDTLRGRAGRGQADQGRLQAGGGHAERLRGPDRRGAADGVRLEAGHGAHPAGLQEGEGDGRRQGRGQWKSNSSGSRGRGVSSR